MPFQSEKQRRYLHANHPEIAKRWEEEYATGGIANHFKFKNGGNATKNIKGQPHMLAYITPKEAKTLENLGGQKTMTKEGIPAYPSSDNYGGTHGSSNEDKGETSSDSGWSPGVSHSGMPSDTGAVTSDAGWEASTTTSDDRPDPHGGDWEKGWLDKSIRPGTTEWSEAEKEDWVEIPERKSPLDGSIRPKQVVPLWKANQLEKIDAHVDEITGFGTQFWFAKTIANTVKNKLPFGMLLPTIYPKVDIHGNVIKDHVTGSDLGHFQGKEWDHLWENVKDDDGGDGPTPLVVPAVMDEMADATGQIDMFDAWDRIKRNQAVYAARQSADDTKVGEWVGDQRLLVNSGGLANLFRVKNQ